VYYSDYSGGIAIYHPRYVGLKKLLFGEKNPGPTFDVSGLFIHAQEWS